jgi:thiamine pyrophosphokinase
MKVHFKLATLKKNNSYVTNDYQQFQQLADALAAVNKPLTAFEMVSFLLAGLGSEYDHFVTSVQTRVEPLPVEELYGHLLAHEL